MMHLYCQFQHIWLGAFFIILLLFSTVFKTTYSSWNILNINVRFETKNWRLPFDWKDPMGYICASTFQYLLGVGMFFIIASLLSIGIGAFLFAVRASTDITNNLELINESIKTNRSRERVLKYLSDFVQFHGDVK